MPYAIEKYSNFAINVWNSKRIKDKKKLATAGINALEKWMKKIDANVSLTQLGFKQCMIKKVIKNVAIQKGCYKKLTKEDIKNILIDSLK